MKGKGQKGELEALLEQAEVRKTQKVKTPKDFMPKVISFTEGAYRKADMIGPIIKELSGDELEWSGFMLAQKGDLNYMVRDILIQKDQDIMRGDIQIDGTAIAKVDAQIQARNKKNGESLYVIGWIHGHGRSALIPSSIDRGNFDIVLNSVSLNTEQSLSVPLKLIETSITKRQEGGKIVFSGDAIEDAIIEYNLLEDGRIAKILEEHGVNLGRADTKEKAALLLSSLLDVANMKSYQPNVFGFSYFVIMNNRHDKPYGAIGLMTEKVITSVKSAELIEKLGILKVQVENDINVSEESLKEEVRSNIKLPNPYLSGIGSIWEKLGAPGSSYVGEWWDRLPGGNKADIKYPSAGYYQPSLWVPPKLIGVLEQKCKENDITPEVKGFLDMLKLVGESRSYDEQLKIIDNYFKQSSLGEDGAPKEPGEGGEDGREGRP